MSRDSNTHTVSIVANTLAPSPGFFKNINLNTLQAVAAPSGPWNGVQGVEAVFRIWTGAVFAPGFSSLGAWVIGGGGHASYAGNELYAFDLSTQLWQRIGYPSPYSESDEVGGLDASAMFPDGMPMPGHTYDGVEYLPAAFGGGPKGSFLVFGRAGSASPKRLWRMPLDTGPNTVGAWIDQFGVQAGLGGYPATAHDTLRNRIWKWSTDYGTTFGYFDMSASTWTNVTPVPYIGPSSSTGCHLPQHDMLIFLCRYPYGNPYPMRLRGLLCTGGSWTLLNVNNSVPPMNIDNVRWGLEWCESGGYAIAYPGGGSTSVWKLHPPATNPLTNLWTWEEQVLVGLNGATPPSTFDQGSNNGNWSKMREVPALSTPGHPCLAFADGKDQPFQLWRL